MASKGTYRECGFCKNGLKQLKLVFQSCNAKDFDPLGQTQPCLYCKQPTVVKSPPFAPLQLLSFPCSSLHTCSTTLCKSFYTFFCPLHIFYPPSGKWKAQRWKGRTGGTRLENNQEIRSFMTREPRCQEKQTGKMSWCKGCVGNQGVRVCIYRNTAQCWSPWVYDVIFLLFTRGLVIWQHELCYQI